LTPGVPVGRFGKTGTYEESLLCQQREFAWTLTNRHGMWWFDMGGGWYDDPRMLAEIGKMDRIAKACMEADGTSVAEVAFVVDDTSSAYLRPSNPFSWPALILQLPDIGRFGAPFDVVHLADLDALPDYKVYVFANCLAPTTEECESIQEKIRQTGAVALWIGPAGISTDGVFDPAAMTALTGIPLELAETDAAWRVVPTGAAADWGWANAAPYGQGRTGGVLPVPKDGVGVVLGSIEGTDLPALVAHEADGILMVFSSVPPLPAGILRAIGRRAGVHLYIDTEDIVWASRDLLAVSVNDGGQRTVRLPYPRRVVDLWTGTTIAGNSDTFSVTLPPHGTGLYRLSLN
jgi:hypothetical protein